MKRKSLQDQRPAPTPKERLNDIIDASKRVPCRLLQIIAQYGLLVAIASNLFPKDLFALAATSKTAYKAIFSRRESRSNLLKKMACDGRGVDLRNAYHKKSIYSSQFNCQANVKCGTLDTSRIVETRPCTSCSHTTCDECRVHCVFQSIYQPAEEPDELPNLSGFALLDPKEMGILTPAHLGLVDNKKWKDFYQAMSTPHHDQGFLDAPLETDAYANMESIAEIVNFDLGSGPLRLSNSSNSPHPSSVIQSFWDITEARKRQLCIGCFEKACNRRGIRTGHECHCSLQAHFLDRWLCLPCFQLEIAAIKKFPVSPSGACACGRSFENTSPLKICLWCCGEVNSTTVAT